MSSGHHSIFEDQARELYYLCDEEKKGYITKDDMYRLTSHLPLTNDQLESVFDSLDDDNNGNLTLDEFILGFSKFLGAPMETPVEEDADFDEESSTMNVVAQEHLDHLVDRMKTVGLTEEYVLLKGQVVVIVSLSSIDMIKETWNKLQNSNADFLSHFESIIDNIISDMIRTKSEYNKLENVLKSKNNTYEEEMKRLYDEMDVQIKTEKERLLNEERKAEKEIKESLEREIREKDQLYQQILKTHEKTVKELQTLSDYHSETNQERERLEKEKKELESRLQQTDKHLRDCQEYIDELNKKAKQDRRNRAKAAIEMTEGIALERESLVRQLDELREINRQLQEEKNRKIQKLDFASIGREMDLAEEMKLAQDIVQPKKVELQDYNRKKRGSILSSYFCPTISVDHSLMDECQNIVYDDEANALNELGALDDFNYKKSTIHDNSSAYCLGPSVNTMSSGCQEIEIQTESLEKDDKLGERCPPDGAVSDLDIPNGLEKPERIFKVVFIGDSSVGKTSIIKRFCNDEFKSEGMSSTIGVDFQIKSIRVDGYFVALQLWDTAGQERFRSITSHYYRKADGVVLVYDILSEPSLINLRRWMENVKSVVEDETELLVLANKSDMIKDDEDQDHAKRLKEILNVENILYFSCSAKTGENIQESLQIMAKNLTNKENNDLKTSIQLDKCQKKSCCGR